MNILLINNNPVVSRLLVLCTRDDTIILHEVDSIDTIESQNYDIIFVDEALYGKKIEHFMHTFKHSKKVLISYRNDMRKGFDVIIKKPFLPSQIIDIIKNARERDEDMQKEVEALLLQAEEQMPTLSALDIEIENIPSVLDFDEIEKIKALLDMDVVDVGEEPLSDDALEDLKIELITEQLKSDGLEIVKEDEMIEEFSIALDGTVQKDSTEEIDIENAVRMAMKNITKKQIKKLRKGKEITITIKLEDVE